MSSEHGAGDRFWAKVDKTDGCWTWNEVGSCIRGHALTRENVYRVSATSVRCRTCHREYQRQRYYANKKTTAGGDPIPERESRRPQEVTW